MGIPGKRPGPGRPKKGSTIAKQKFRDVLAAKITAEAEEWISAVRNSALGAYIIVEKDGKKIKGYTKAPDINAWRTATERAFGRPEESSELTGEIKLLIDV